MANESKLRSEHLSLLLETSQKLNIDLDLHRLQGEIVTSARRLSEADDVVLLLRKKNTSELDIAATTFDDDSRAEQMLRTCEPFVEQASHKSNPVVIQHESGSEQERERLEKLQLSGFICIPIKDDNTLAGVLCCSFKAGRAPLDSETIALLEHFAQLAGSALSNSRYQHETHAQLMRCEKIASLGYLVAAVAHEINTPLAAVSSNNDMFLRCFDKLENVADKPAGTTQEVEKVVDMLRKLSQVNRTACDRIGNLVQSLRRFSRVDETEVIPANLHDALNNTLLLTAHLNRGRIEVVKNYGEIPELTCKINQLSQVFMNILVNAMQAISDRGKITVTTSSDENEIVVAISDTGEGITSENLEKIFEPGFTTKSAGVGTGLGLAISRGIVEKHQGRIEVSSTRGEGTTFTLHLPHQNGMKKQQKSGIKVDEKDD